MDKLTRILLVSSDRTAAFLQQRLLLRMAAAQQVVVAEDSAQALAELAPATATGGKPNLILFDLQPSMPEGFAFLRAYAQLSAQQQAPLVVLTLLMGLQARELAALQELPVVGVFDKPLTPEKVTRIRCLGYAQARATGS